MTFFFFFNDTATTEIYTLSLHDALPIWPGRARPRRSAHAQLPDARSRHVSPAYGRAHTASQHRAASTAGMMERPRRDRKSTRLNSSHANISYAVFCLKKKKYKLEHHTCY